MPILRKGYPLNMESEGKYFAYLTGRKYGFSSLEEDLGTLSYDNLSRSYSKGYSDLWVCERLYIIDKLNAEKEWEPADIDIEPFERQGKYAVFDEKEVKKLFEDYISAKKFCQQGVTGGNDYYLMIAKIIKDYYWH